MPSRVNNDLRISLEDAHRRVAAAPKNFVALFRRQDVDIEFYAPREVDGQSPHDRDEIYIIASGSGMFVRGNERTPFRPGDFLFVAAGIPHRFEAFTNGFSTWVIFFGPKTPA